MSAFVPYLLCLLGAIALCASLLPGTRLLAPVIGAVDVPRGARRMHTDPIPRCGGIAMLLAFWAILFATGHAEETLLPLLLGTAALLLVGLPDDVLGVPASIKLAVQLAAAAIAVRPLHWSVPATLAAALWLTLLTNAHNMIDGVDGLAGTTVAIEAAALALLLYPTAPTAALVATALLGVCLGYLPFNVHPARLFMGDEGALPLGFIVGWLTLQLPDAGSAGAPAWRALFVCALPLIDLTLTVLRRLLQGKNPLRADRGHLHHLLADRGLSQRRICLALCLPAAAAALLAVFLP
ncbi:MAG: undecaprenyl/decaprenyl-phosphate alpha-N-acetylglucosaminyl 1-phosphate transferase [Clostridia bacterium]|nr:undecaprenyl/decaprenyl-phosphate alpha-N-acetylglucosaminyl 1-phosphate transferase [Clostridia bacterium]MBQ8717791.1 undecaprenyl/decaprenyl-phosphate alpha-N-acetylglucosaminyl 1-phosphate transferase [Clostridia bacterium]